MSYAAVRIMPQSRWCEWPAFLVLPDWACDLTEEPTMKFWDVRFQGVNANGGHRWFIWRIPGLRGDWKDFRKRLAKRAGELGLTCVYIYNDPRPMSQEMFDMVVADNKNDSEVKSNENQSKMVSNDIDNTGHLCGGLLCAGR